MRRFDFGGILRNLARHEVEFIVVGGVSAVLQGAPATTVDLDIVYRLSPANIERILVALESLGARFRMRPDLSPNVSHLESMGRKLLATDLGSLDLLGSIGKQLTYEDLIDRTDQMKVCEFSVRVLRLETLIEIKEQLGGEKDLAMLPTLRRTLEEKRRLK
jgi:hypothetical protein